MERNFKKLKDEALQFDIEGKDLKKIKIHLQEVLKEKQFLRFRVFFVIAVAQRIIERDKSQKGPTLLQITELLGDACDGEECTPHAVRDALEDLWHKYHVIHKTKSYGDEEQYYTR